LETCETMNDAWGYNMIDRRFKSFPALIHYMVNAAGRNANFLLNVGPMPNGQIQHEFTDTLAKIGKWMEQYGSSIYGTRGNIIPEQPWGVVTGKDKIFYAHILHQPGQTYIFIPAVNKKIASVTLLKDQSILKFKQQPEGVFIYLDGVQLDAIDTVIQLNINE